MITRDNILLKLRELKPYLYSNFAVREIGVFGSFSDNTNTENSDIDILVELDRPIGWKFLTLEMYLESVFDRKIDLVSKNALKEQIKDIVLKQVNYAW